MQQAQLLVIYEVTMGHRYIYECLDHSLHNIKGSKKLFVELTILISGDWKHILPVVTRGSWAQIIDAILKRSYIWEHIQTLELHLNHHVQLSENTENSNFSLLRIGNGIIPWITELGQFIIKIEQDLCHTTKSLIDLYHFVF